MCDPVITPMIFAAVFGGVTAGAGMLNDKEKQKTAREAAEIQTAANAAAGNTLTEQYNKSVSAVNTGYTDAANAIDAGYNGVDPNMYTGLAGYNGANQSLDTGYNASKTYLEGGLTGLKGAMKPYQEAGGTALTQYMNMLSGAYEPQADPAFLKQQQFLKQRMAAMGISQGPSNVQAGYSPLIGEMYTRQLNALTPVMNQGYNASVNVGQGEMNTGTNLSNLSTNYATNKGNLSTGYAGIKAGLATEKGGNLSNLYGAYGANMGNLQTAAGDIEASKSISQVNTFWQNLSQGMGAAYGVYNAGAGGTPTGTPTGMPANSSNAGMSNYGVSDSGGYMATGMPQISSGGGYPQQLSYWGGQTPNNYTAPSYNMMPSIFSTKDPSTLGSRLKY